MAGDVLVFLVFALIGLSSHERNPSLTSLLRAGLPFLGAWLSIGGLFGVFNRDTAAGTSAMRTVLPVWLPAWLIGLVLRAVVFGRAVEPAFAVVSFVANGILLVGWRTGFGFFAKRNDKKTRG